MFFEKITQNEYSTILYIERYNITYEAYAMRVVDAFLKECTFDDKQSYLEWVRLWKEKYKKLSDKIRQLKKERKTVHFVGQYKLSNGGWDAANKQRAASGEAFLAIRLREFAKHHSRELRLKRIDNKVV